MTPERTRSARQGRRDRASSAEGLRVAEERVAIALEVCRDLVEPGVEAFHVRGHLSEQLSPARPGVGSPRMLIEASCDSTARRFGRSCGSSGRDWRTEGGVRSSVTAKDMRGRAGVAQHVRGSIERSRELGHLGVDLVGEP